MSQVSSPPFYFSNFFLLFHGTVAENTAPKAESSFGVEPTKDKPAEGVGRKWEFKEDWGEKYDGVFSLGLYVLQVETGVVGRIGGLPEDITPGQVNIDRFELES